MIEFILNDKPQQLDVAPDTPLLWVLRDHLHLTGTKFGCGAGLCGACTIIIDGSASRSCITPISAVAGRSVTTIEGLGGSHPVQRSWIEHSVPQCGYCQSGQIMGTVALLQHNGAPSTEEIKSALAGNICRCGTYQRIVAAVHSAAELARQEQALFYNAAPATTPANAALQEQTP